MGHHAASVPGSTRRQAAIILVADIRTTASQHESSGLCPVLCRELTPNPHPVRAVRSPAPDMLEGIEEAAG